MRIRAAVAYRPGEPLRIETVNLDAPREREVVIKLATAGLCHSDLNYISGEFSCDYPVILGHEGFGHVVECGPGVTQVSLDDAVIPYLIPDCGTCIYCRSGRTNFCSKMARGMTELANSPFSNEGGERIARFVGLSTFAEYAVVHEDQLAKVNAAVPASEACCIGCGVSTGIGAATITAKVTPGSSVAVFGLGGVGLSVIQGARLSGATRIFAIDVNEGKEEHARQLGATDFLNPAKVDVLAEIRRLTEIGVDYSFECVGKPELVRTALDCVNRGWGKAIIVGLTPDSKPFSVPSSALAGKSWTRTVMGDAKRADVSRIVDWFMDGRISLDGLVSHRLPLEQINEGFDLMKTGQSNRAVIDFSL